MLNLYLPKSGIMHQNTCVNTPRQNRVAERKNRHILEVTRSFLMATNVPKQFLREAILSPTLIYAINKMTSYILNFNYLRSTLQKSYPTNRINTSIPLKVFGCSAFVHNHNPNSNKIDAKSLKCIWFSVLKSPKGV